MSTPLSPELCPLWKTPQFYRCPTCAAVLLTEADLAVHEKWHEKAQDCITNPMITVTTEMLNRYMPSQFVGDYNETAKVETPES